MKKYHAGDEITVTVDRAGLAEGEGIAHMPDETMVVLLDADKRVGETVQAVVTNVLQTSLGDSLMAYVKN